MFCLANRIARLVAALILISVGLTSFAHAQGSDSESKLKRGELIYSESCASCHGEKGEGVEDAYEEPLAGDLSIGELADVITRTMPEGEPKECVGADAEAVAAFVHHAFYSEAARVRNRPPKVLLTHLTASQFRQSVSDLYARFAGTNNLDPKRGLTGTYYTTMRQKKENQKIERIDPQVSFDWKHEGPGEGIDPKEFFIRWRGGVWIPETGRYEIVLRSTCAFMCNFGSYNREFINNRVQSGNKTEFRKSIYLTAGRVYPLQIDLYQRKRKTEQPPAEISLSWVPPHGTEEVIPQRHLTPSWTRSAFALQTKLPPDDRSYGYNRGLSVDRQWDDSVTSGAVEFSHIAADELWPNWLRQNKGGSDENRGKLRTFLTKLVETAFRGPLDEASRKFYIDTQVASAEDDGEAIRRCVLVALKSPRFLYPGLDTDRSPSQRAANRLALTLFDSVPSDEWLLQAASKNQLDTEQRIRSAAQRMINDPRVRGKTRELMYEWLNLGHLGDITKNAEDFPEFNDEIVSDLKASLDAFLDNTVWGEASDYRQLFLADRVWTNERLHSYYGTDWKPEGEAKSGLVQTASTKKKTGVLSHPYIMSGLAYQDSTSPIHRGVFLIRFVLGRTIRPPQEAFTPLNPDLHPDLTTRQRVELQTSPEGCRACHKKINGLGFALENFDADGRFRLKESGKPLNTAGHYTTRDGKRIEFNGATELAEFLASSHDSHRAFVNRAFHHFVKQPVAAYGPDRLDQLTEQFRKSNFHILNLLVEIAVIAASQPEGSTK